LAKYVQQATGAGVTQAVFPEGGLSLDGSLAEPKVGILKYILEGAAAAKRDVVFVPIALNYDRVLEDTILLRAQAKGERKFRARISVVFKAILRQAWLRITGKFHRFGYAAVSFGEPLTLSHVDEAESTPDALSATIMGRIAAAVPVLPVPLISYLLLTNGTMRRDALEIAFTDILKRLDAAQVHVPRNNRDYAVEFGLRNLIERRLVVDDGDEIGIALGMEEIVGFYANSVRHLM
jgi:glycerol-3-phosphate O-acyltransferase